MRPFRRSRSITATLTVVGLGLTAGACGSRAMSSAKAAPAVAPAAVTIDTFQFGPKRMEVRVGTTVTWTNHDEILHTVTSGTRAYDPGNSGLVIDTRKDGVFDMPLNGRGATASFTFTKPGSFHYFCDRHPGMEADVVVQ